MKTFLQFMIIFLLCSHAQSQEAYKYFPDVMNNVNVLDEDGVFKLRKVNGTDSFPVYPGFPKTVTGQSFEGGIFCQMDGDAELEVVYAIGSTIQAWNIDGSNVTGWPISMSFNSQGAPAYGDIDGDGQGEIVMGTSNFVGNAGAVYAFEKNGIAVTGFPITHGANQRSIVLADLDNNGSLEIITNKRISPIGEVWVYRGNGTVYSGWPKQLNHVPGSSSAVGDITGDGIPEIVSESFTGLYAFTRDGNTLPGFPFLMPNGDVNSYSSPVLADLDGDSEREIIFGTHNTTSGAGNIYVLKNNGTVFTGWPKPTNQWVYGPVTVGFINGDNILDIIVADQVASGIPADYIYCWDRNGNSLQGFPIGPINGVNNQVSVADIDNDNQYELIVDDNSTDAMGRGQYHAYNHDGTPLPDWPVYTTGTSFFNMPSIADLNSDGMIDLIGAGFQFGGSGIVNVYAWNTGLVHHPQRIINPVWQYNVRHNGVYGDNAISSLNEPSLNLANEFVLHQNFPNPFNPVTTFSYDLRKSARVELTIYSVDGKHVETLVNKFENAGKYEIDWNASYLASGIYFYKLSAGEFSQTKHLVLVK